MCGIFGIAFKPNASIKPDALQKLLTRLFQLSESRGKESAGIHIEIPNKGLTWLLKSDQSPTALLKNPSYKKIINETLDALYVDGQLKESVVILAHSRLVTNGSAIEEKNNQPVRVNKTTVIHNGIIVNVDEIWKTPINYQRQAAVDTEVIAALLADKMDQAIDPIKATQQVYELLKGSASIAWSQANKENLILATNTGDTYYLTLPNTSGIIFASERHILSQAISPLNVEGSIEWLMPGNGLYLPLTLNQSFSNFTLPSIDRKNNVSETCQHTAATTTTHSQQFALLKYNESALLNLKRCTRCILPETFPFIEFDKEGVCSYCHSYKPRYQHMHPTESKSKFIQSLEKYRNTGQKSNVLVPFSGGRDSSYGLHLINKEFNLNPITFTYDWGMVTDLARRNIARMCGQLGIQNILVSADIKMKRANIRKNVSAWLKKPDLGIVPLFMAGDKHFFTIVNELKRQTGIELDLWCANPLENTDFKSGFCGVAPDFDKKRVDYLSISRKLKLATYYARNFVTNPSYLNSSLIDTLQAFKSYYFEPRKDFYFMFDHFIWNEDEVNKTLLDEYEWEISPDSPSTWRIGDGTAPFYNYIYLTARGFSEFDTFRSNQIREGMVTREAAMSAIIDENRPRAESLKWYLDTLNLDFDTVIKKINTLDTLGLHQ